VIGDHHYAYRTAFLLCQGDIITIMDTEKQTEESGLSNDTLRDLVEKNSELIAENNVLLKKIYRHGVWGFWLKIMWYVLVFGLPFALYFYILEPYFTALGSSYDTFSTGIAEIPGLKQFMQWLGTGKGE
jgi:hypothetical protein